MKESARALVQLFVLQLQDFRRGQAVIVRLHLLVSERQAFLRRWGGQRGHYNPDRLRNLAGGGRGGASSA